MTFLNNLPLVSLKNQRIRIDKFLMKQRLINDRRMLNVTQSKWFFFYFIIL